MEYLLSNRPLLIAIGAWVAVQFLKVIVNLAVDRKLDLGILLSSGGMPSSHAAIVISLAVSVGKSVGVASPIFAVAAIVACIVMYDAAGVRRAVGIQAGILNRIIEEYFVEHNFSEKRLRELIGHTPSQVFAGAALGFAIGWVWG